ESSNGKRNLQTRALRRIPEPCVYVFIDRGFVRKIGDPVAQRIDHREVTELDGPAGWLRMVQDARNFSQGAEQRATNVIRRVPVVESDSHGHAVSAIWTGEIAHLLGHELAVRDENGVAVLGLDTRRPPSNL